MPNVRKSKRQRTKQLTHSLRIKGWVLVLAGILMMGTSLAHWWIKQAALRFDRKLLLEYQLREIQQADSPHPTHVFIKWFIDTEVTDGLVNDSQWTVSDTGATYLTQSARPGQPGNIILYGHNTRQILGNIRALKGYEKIKLTLSDGSEKWYQVREMHQVAPSNVMYLAPTETEILTMYTCAGWGDRERFIIRATPIPPLGGAE